ncbi:MAG: hypothetical protein IJ043_06260 [Clostridia bacterium]|nr:hypothetical protein [Clostridia bacterium]
MAYENFKPTMWAATIDRNLHQKSILVDWCNQKVKGQPNYGNKLEILGNGTVNIFDYDTETGLGAPETPEGGVTHLLIDQQKAFNFKVDDIDNAQTTPDLMPALMDEATEKLASARDLYVAEVGAGSSQISAALTIATPVEAKAAIDKALKVLRKNNVAPGMSVRIELAYWMYQLFRDYLVEAKTANDELIKNGTIGMYDGCQVAFTNNLKNDGTNDYMMVRTNKAIAFAGRTSKVEPYRPQNFFADAVKGLNVFGAVIARPKEIYVIKAKDGTEA